MFSINNDFIKYFLIFRFKSKCICIQSDANTENNTQSITNSKVSHVKIKSFENKPRRAWGPISPFR